MIDLVQTPETGALEAFCRRHRIQKLAVFGSALRDDFRPDSDLDLLVEFQPGAVPGLAFFALQDELSTMFGRTVDLNTANCLSPEFRDRVLRAYEYGCAVCGFDLRLGNLLVTVEAGGRAGRGVQRTGSLHASPQTL